MKDLTQKSCVNLFSCRPLKKVVENIDVEQQERHKRFENKG